MGPDPTVSVIVPCRNEEPFIGVCLECLCSQTYPSALLQIIVVDGRSTDSTRNIVMHYTARDARVRLLSNAQQFVASGLNQAIDVAIGEVIIRVDAHTTVSSDFIEQSVALLRAHPEAWSVGGPVVHVGRGTTGRSIAIAMSHPFGVGNARHRFADYEGYVEGTAMPSYWRWTFDRIGVFDEELIRNEDDDLNLRITKHGGRVYVSPTVRYSYWVRNRLDKLFHQYLQYGYWKLSIVRKHRCLPSIRMFIPTALVTVISAWILSLIFGWTSGAVFFGTPVVAYTVANVCVAAMAGWGETVGTVVRLPMVFAVMHIGYGLGFGLALMRWAVGLADRPPLRMTNLTR